MAGDGNSRKKLDLTNTLLSVIGTVIIAMAIAIVPWAYEVHGRLVRIETSLSKVLNMEDRLDRLQLRVIGVESRVEAIEGGQS